MTTNDQATTDQRGTQAELGFIGMGHMGSLMAQRLLAAGYPLAVYDRTPEKAQALGQLGALVTTTPGDLAAHSNVVLVSVTDDAAQEHVMFDQGGALAGLRAGATIIDLSTVSPNASRRLYQAAREKDVAMIDAPVSGSVAQVEQGSLVIFVGGDPEIYDRCRPILAVLGASIFYMGPSGRGTIMKLVVNDLLGVGMQALAEAIALGQKAGIDKDVLMDVLEQTAVLTPGQKGKLANVRSGQYPAQFALSLMHKDFGLILRQAAEDSVAMPATAVAQQMYTAAMANGKDADFSIMIQFMQALAGVPDGKTNLR
jgi:3-hydroxyisobutyrate dehydrogenase-like beta-hydroxyacid dehydrogenase